MKNWFLFFLLLWGGTLTAVDFNSNLPPEELANALLARMSPEDQLAQVLMFGYPGEIPPPEIFRWIEDRKLGSIKVYGRNAGNLDTLVEVISTMQSLAVSTDLKIPLLIATDQEGGIVRHVRGQTSITAGNMSLGASGLPDDSYRTGYYIGRELRRLGINMNFAPTVDILLNPKADVIGTRSFTRDPVEAGVLGTAFYRGVDEWGVISTAKHFPGHGNTDKDSHGTLPVVPADLALLRRTDILPYKIMIQGGVPAIMVAHIAYPQITGDQVPASLSSVIIQDVLRKELGYEGVIVTDDLIMYGARYEGRTIAQSAEMALEAGNDILLVGRDLVVFEEIWRLLLKRMGQDDAYAQRVQESVRRILLMKIEYFKREVAVPYFPEAEGLEAELVAPRSQEFFYSQSFRGVTVVRQKSFPIAPESRVLVVGRPFEFRRQGMVFFENARTLTLPATLDEAQQEELVRDILAQVWDRDYVIINFSGSQDLRIIQRLESLKEKLIVISSRVPSSLGSLPWVENALAIFGVNTPSYQAGMAAIRGDFKPQGKMPVELSFQGD